MEERNQELLSIISDLMKVIDQLMTGIAHSYGVDFMLLNDTLVLASRKLLEEGFSDPRQVDSNSPTLSRK